MSTARSKRKFMELTTAHGIADIAYHTNYGCKAFWLILIIVANLQICSQIYVFMKDYFDDPKWVTTVGYKSVEDGLELPNITICNVNTVNSTRIALDASRVSVEVFGFIAVGFYLLYDPKQTSMWPRLQMMKFGYEGFINNRSLSQSFRKELQDMRRQVVGLSMTDCETTFLRCYSDQYGEELPCCDAHSIVISDEDICTTFSPRDADGSMVKQITPGPSGGFSMMLDPGLRYTTGMYGQDTSNGFKIYFNYARNPYFRTNDPIYLAPGTDNYVALELEKEQFNEPRGVYSGFQNIKLPCRVGGEMEVIQGTYSTAACFADCEYAAIVHICSCSVIGPIKVGVKVCTPLEAFDCINRFQQDSTLSLIKSNDSSKFVDKVRLSQLTDSDFESMTRLTFYFKSATYKQIDTKLRITVDALLSSIGGSMGIFAGMSLITVVQVIVYFGEWIVSKMKGCAGKGNDEKSGRGEDWKAAAAPGPSRAVIFGINDGDPERAKTNSLTDLTSSKHQMMQVPAPRAVSSTSANSVYPLVVDDFDN